MEAIVVTLVAGAFVIGLVVFSKTKKGKVFFGEKQQQEKV
jgi:hypothetical protein